MAGGEAQCRLDLDPNEASAMLRVEHPSLLADHGWDRAFWIALDSGDVSDCIAVIGHSGKGGGDAVWDIERLRTRRRGDPGKAEDAEALARRDGWVYAFGSQYGGGDGPLQPERAFVARFREADVDHVDHEPAVDMEIAHTELRLHRLVNDALSETGPELAPLGEHTRRAFIDKTREQAAGAPWLRRLQDGDVPINVEGATFRADGTLLLGLRFPVAADGRPLLVSIAGIERLFGGGEPEILGFWVVDAIGRNGGMAGVRDLDQVGDVLHLITGDLDSAKKDSVVRRDHPSGRDTMSTHWRTTLPDGRHGGEVSAERVREFPELPRIEGIATDAEGRFFYVSDEDEGVLLRFTTLVAAPPP